MSLIKQLWISVILILAINSAISFFILFYSAKSQFEEQLYLNNVDSANSLALVLTQAEKSKASIQLLMSAKFDAGHYELIKLTGNEDQIIELLTYESGPDEVQVPRWFKHFVKFNAPAGVAQVSDGWSQFGTLYVKSQTTHAYEAFWQKFKNFLLSIVVVTLVLGGLGSLFLKIILKPLNNLVYQANNFAQRRFVKIKAPWTTDFSRVVKAMNSLADRFKVLAIENNKRLEDARYRSQNDPVTGLPNINAFFTLLESQLRFRDRDGQNVLVMHSVNFVDDELLSSGPDKLNEVIKYFSNTVIQFYEDYHRLYTDYRIARINETDIAVILTDCVELSDFKQQFNDYCQLILTEHEVLKISSAAVYIQYDEPSHSLLDRADLLLEEAQMSSLQDAFVYQQKERASYIDSLQQWAEVFNDVSVNTELIYVPVKDANGLTRHSQALFKLNQQFDNRSFSFLVEPARRLEKLIDLDLFCVSTVLKKLTADPELKLAILLYQELLLDQEALQQLSNMLRQFETVCPRLSIEFRETSAAKFPSQFRQFVERFKTFGIGLGLKRVGKSFSQITDVHEFGLNYLKIDSAYVYDVGNHQSNQIYLGGLADLAHSLGMSIIADGVISDNDQSILFQLGFDGVARIDN